METNIVVRKVPDAAMIIAEIHSIEPLLTCEGFVVTDGDILGGVSELPGCWALGCWLEESFEGSAPLLPTLQPGRYCWRN